MPISFAGIAPHSPLLHERIGKSHREKLSATLTAYAELERCLYAAKPQTIVVLTPHGTVASEAFTIDLAERYEGKLEQFGDFSRPQNWPADIELAQQLRAADETQRRTIALQLVHQAALDYGVTIPLALLGAHVPHLAVVPLHVAGLPAIQHWRFGQFLGGELRASRRRVALLASADLSHRLTTDSPAGFAPEGPAFDRQMLELLRRGDAAAMVDFPGEVVAAAAPCGYLPIVTMLGALDGMPWHSQVLSYEGPFGIGQLVGHFDLT